jgi:multicomponent Na+:H+ antiporter subunit B
MSPETVILRAVRGPLSALILAAAAAILLRGHDAPGGGFIAGLVASAAFVVRAIAKEPAGTGAAWRPGSALAVSGVLLALASGLAGPLRGQPFLTHAHGAIRLGPLAIPVSTVLLFDAGVFLCVLGAVGGLARGLMALEGQDRQEGGP